MNIHESRRRERRRNTSRRNLLVKASSIDWTGSSSSSTQCIDSWGVPEASIASRGVSTPNTSPNQQRHTAADVGNVRMDIRAVFGETERRAAAQRRPTVTSSSRSPSTSPPPPQLGTGNLGPQPKSPISPLIAQSDTTGPPKSRRKQALRKTLSDNVSGVSRRAADLTVEDLTLNDTERDSGTKRAGDSEYSARSGAATMRNIALTQQDSCSSSCPNLVVHAKAGTRASAARYDEVEEEVESSRALQRPLSTGSDSNFHGSQQKVMPIPDIFVTSFTHSATSTQTRRQPGWQESAESVASDPEVAGGRRGSAVVPIVFGGTKSGGPQSRYRHSAPELSSSPLAASAHASYWTRLRESLRSNLTRNLLDSRALPSKPSVSAAAGGGGGGGKEAGSGSSWLGLAPRCSGDCDGCSLCNASSPLLAALRDPRMAKVLSYLYIGNMETAYDERLMCRLGIRSVIDLSNIAPEDVPAHKRNPAPCVCGSPERHLKATLRLGLACVTSDLAEMQSNFLQINKFIEGARKVEKKVLVVCTTGNSVSALAVMQYLMVHRGCNLRKAHAMVMRQGMDIDLSAGHQRLLQTLEARLLPTEKPCMNYTLELSRPSLGVPNYHSACLTREAWTTGDSDI